MEVALPRLGLEPRGYRRLKSTLSKRLSRRLSELGLETARDYLARLRANSDEWAVLDALSRMSISRFYRDAAVFDELARSHLPELAARAERAGRRGVAAWSAGCASGEEAYSLALLWQLAICPSHPRLGIEIFASDADERLLERARAARYAWATLRELPAAWREQAFDADGEMSRLKEPIRRLVHFERRDLRRSVPAGSFDLVLCRNTAFTYFDAALRQQLAERVWSALPEGGVFVIGIREALPDAESRRWISTSPGVYVKPV
jgi:chemotaxis protein methyltransferase CheR